MPFITRLVRYELVGSQKLFTQCIVAIDDIMDLIVECAFPWQYRCVANRAISFSDAGSGAVDLCKC